MRAMHDQTTAHGRDRIYIFYIHSTIVMWSLSVKFSIIMVNKYDLRDWRETEKKMELLNDFIIVLAILLFASNS